MARVELAPGVLEDLDRFLVHLRSWSVADAEERLEALLRGLDVLATSPLLGRPVKGGQRELIIGRHARGYVARYRYVPELDCVFVLALRAQREGGFKPRR